MQLTPLMCAACGAPVPLRDGNPLTCGHCSGSVPVPEAYDKLRQALRREAADQEKAARVYAHLVRPPGAAYQFWVGLGTAWTLVLVGVVVVGVLFGLILAGHAFFTETPFDLTTAGVAAVAIAITFIPVSAEWFFHANAVHFHTDFADVLSMGRLHALLALFTVLILGIPLAMSAFYEAMEIVRKELQSAMAAHPPAQEGGPATCRQCGAPLDVVPGALGALCLYCGTDNLLTVQASAAKEAEKEAGMVHKTVDDAVRQEREVWLEARLAPVKLLGAAAIAVPILWGGGWLTEKMVENGPLAPDWNRSMHAAPALYSSVKGRSNVGVGESATLTYIEDEHHVQETDDFKSQSFQTAYYFVPLRRGQSAPQVTSPDDGVQIQVQRRATSPWYAPEWTWETQDTPVNQFVAPYSGWYRIKVARWGDSGDPVHFTFAVSN